MTFIAISKVILCLAGWVLMGSAIERSTKIGRLNLWLDLQIAGSLGLSLTAAFISS